MNVDIIGLGNLIYRKKPEVWAEIAEQWDEIFPQLQIDVNVEVKIMRTGLVGSPFEAGR